MNTSDVNYVKVNSLITELELLLSATGDDTLQTLGQLKTLVTTHEEDSIKWVQYAVDDIVAVLSDTDVPFVYTVLDNGSQQFTVNNRYGFLYSNPVDYRLLLNWLDWLQIECGIHPINKVDNSIVVTTSLEVPVIKDDKQVPLTLTSHAIHEDKHKRQSVNLMESVRVDIKESKNLATKKQLDSRLSIVDDVLTTQGTLFKELLTHEYIDDFIKDTSRHHEISIDQFSINMSEYLIETGVEVSTTMMRAIVEVMITNRKYDMLDVNFFVIEPPHKWSINLDDKNDIFALALNNLSCVTENKHLMTFSVNHLIIYLEDYCSRGSSLQVAVGPEELVHLATAVYELFAVHNFDINFVYATDMNNVHEVNRSDWHDNNLIVKDVVKHGRLRRLPNLSKYTHGLIMDIINSRDVTLTTPSLTHSAMVKLFGIVECNTKDKFDIHYNSDDNITLFTGVYLDRHDNVDIEYLIVVEDGLAFTLSRKSDAFVQTYYSTNNAPTYIKFLRYTLHNLN